MHKKKPSLTVVQFDPGEEDLSALPQEDIYDPDKLDGVSLADEMEELQKRREEGSRRIEQMKDQAERVRRSIKEAQIIRPAPESSDMASQYAGDSAAIRRRQQQRQAQYVMDDEPDDAPKAQQPAQDTPLGYFGDPLYERPLTYVDDDEQAPIFYDGYTPDSGDQGALTDEEYMPRRVQTRAAREDAYESFSAGRRRKNRAFKV
ncbi:MAG: hypothetical protein Q4F18_14795, partial [Clostridia bacterium]|nr:hypothetical protein [Clostridia bacterium]